MYRFGEWLRRERLEHGWSQVELAERTYERNLARRQSAAYETESFTSFYPRCPNPCDSL